MGEDDGSTVHTQAGGAGSANVRVAVYAQRQDALEVARAKELAHRLGVAFGEAAEPSGETCDLALMVGPAGLGLVPVTGPKDLTHGHPVRIDWSGIDVTSGPGRAWDQPILKAVGLKSRSQGLCIVDGTAGLGEDAFVMASFGAKVVMLERGAVMAAMLEDHLARLNGTGIGGRMSVVHADAGTWLNEENIRQAGADVVYLDFMFPSGRKTAERKPMKVLRMLAGGDDDAGLVLEKAIASGVKRVVVKRPAKAAWVGGKEPSHAIVGKSLRFDVYMKKGLGAGV